MQTKKQRTFNKALQSVIANPSIRKIKRLCNTIKALCRENRKEQGPGTWVLSAPSVHAWNKSIKQMRKQYKV